MPRPLKHYTRPTEVVCRACRGSISVAAAGRIPEFHPDCARLVQDIRRVVASLDAAVVGRSVAELRELRSRWGNVTSDGNTIWNRVLNPARRGGS